MRILIKGIDRTNFIRSLGDEESVSAYFEQIKDKAPIGDEEVSHWQERNNNLLAAMLSLLTEESHKPEEEEEPPLFDYDSLEEEDSVEYSQSDVYIY